MSQVNVVTLTGPSCAGKTTLECMLVSRGFARLTSMTTRDKRPGEEDGKDYHFVDKLNFQRMSDNGDIVESAWHDGHRYGTSRSEVERAASTGKPIVVVVEPFGAKQLIRHANYNGWQLHSVFLHQPIEALVARMMVRAQSGNLNIYTNRMISLITVESAWVNDGWYDECISHDSLVDLARHADRLANRYVSEQAA